MAQIEVQPFKRVTGQEQKKTKHRISDFFQVNDIFPAVISFLLARVVMLGGMSPFGVAFFAAVYTKKKMWIPLFGVTLGAWSVGMDIGMLKYPLAMLLFTVYKLLLDKDSRFPTAINCLVAGVALFASGMLFMALDMILIYSTLILFLESLVCGFMVVVFRETVPLMDKNALKNYLSNEQLLSLAVTFGIIMSGLTGIAKLGPISIGEIICIAIVLVVALYRGAGMGACVGVAAGLVFGINSPDILPILGIYAFCGFVAGCMRPLGKFGVGIGFVMAGVIMSVYTASFTTGVISIYSILIGTVLFLAIPKKVHSFIGNLVSGLNVGDMDKPYVARIREVLTGRLGSVSESFAQLAATFDDLSVKRTKAYQADIAHLFDDAADRICKSCGMCVHCWEKDFDVTYQSLFKLTDKLEQKGYADVLDVPEHFRKRCLRIDDLVGTINHLYDIYRLNSVWSAQVDESRKLVSQQYMGFSNMMRTLSEEIAADLSFENKMESKIATELLRQKIHPKQVCVFETSTGRTQAEVLLNEEEELQYEGDVLLTVSEVLGQPMRLVDVPSEEGEFRLRFEPQFNYSITSGISKLKKEGQSKSGDNCCAMSLSDNRYVMAISDGMGSGKRAAAESGVTISLLEQLLSAGFDRMATVNLINSALVLKSGVESFATIDVSLIDLMSGTAEFVKIGSAASYIKREDGRVDTIYCTSLPAGILTTVDMELSSKRLFDGDMLIMVSDGVADAKRGVDWIEEYLQELDSDDPEEVAELILKEAVICKKGHVDDDMTVVAARIWEKEEI